MTAGPFYLGQIPLQPLTINVVDESGTAVNLADYTSFSLVLFDPSGLRLSTTGVLERNPDVIGQVSYEWDSTSLFNKVGTYSYQLQMVTSTVNDYTRPAEFKVLPLGGNK